MTHLCLIVTFSGKLKSVVCPFCGTSTHREINQLYTHVAQQLKVSLFWCEHCAAVAAIGNRIKLIKIDDLIKKYPTIDPIPNTKYYLTKLLHIRGFAVAADAKVRHNLPICPISEYIERDIRRENYLKNFSERKCLDIEKHIDLSKNENIRGSNTFYGFFVFVSVSSKNLSNPKVPYPIDFYKLDDLVFLSFGSEDDETGSVSFSNKTMPWFCRQNVD